MFSNTQTEMVVHGRPAELKPTASPRVEELMTLGRGEAWDFALLGQAPMPTQPVRVKDWLIVPAEQDSSEIPVQALARVSAIFAAGIRPKGFILVHEAPMFLPAPQEEQEQFLEAQWMLDPESTQKVIEKLSFGVTTLAKVMAGAVTLATTVILPAIFLTGAALLDPILIAVTEDDYWVEIDRWWV